MKWSSDGMLRALTLSVALHAVLLGGFMRPQLLSGVALQSAPLQLRVVTASEAPLAASEAAPSTVASTLEAVVTPPPVPEAAQSVAQASVDASTPPGIRAANAYRASASLDTPPRPLDPIDPDYPPEAGGVEGTVLLRLRINSSGGVDEVTVLRATPPGYFEASALAAFGKARFSPGYFLGIPVASEWLVEVGYTPINRVGAVSGQGR